MHLGLCVGCALYVDISTPSPLHVTRCHLTQAFPGHTVDSPVTVIFILYYFLYSTLHNQTYLLASFLSVSLESKL